MAEEEIMTEEPEVQEEAPRGDAPHTETIELTEEELDKVADTAIDALQGILKHFDVGEVTIDEYEGDEGELILDITGDNLAILIGRHGKTLDALQFIIPPSPRARLGSVTLWSWTLRGIRTVSVRSLRASLSLRRTAPSISSVALSCVL